MIHSAPASTYARRPSATRSGPPTIVPELGVRRAAFARASSSFAPNTTRPPQVIVNGSRAAATRRPSACARNVRTLPPHLFHPSAWAAVTSRTAGSCPPTHTG